MRWVRKSGTHSFLGVCFELAFSAALLGVHHSVLWVQKPLSGIVYDMTHDCHRRGPFQYHLLLLCFLHFTSVPDPMKCVRSCLWIRYVVSPQIAVWGRKRKPIPRTCLLSIWGWTDGLFRIKRVQCNQLAPNSQLVSSRSSAILGVQCWSLLLTS